MCKRVGVFLVRVGYAFPEGGLDVESILGFVWDQLGDARVATALIAWCAWAGRTRIAHFLSKDLEATKARHLLDLEEKKAQYQRELESYRTSLIAETEAIKAAQDVRRTMAISMSSKRLDAMHNVLMAFTGVCVELVTLHRSAAGLNPVLQSEKLSEWTKRLETMKAADKGATPFTSHELKLCLGEIQTEVINVITGLFNLISDGVGEPPTSQVAEEFKQRLFELQMKFDSELREYVASVLQMR